MCGRLLGRYEETSVDRVGHGIAGPTGENRRGGVSVGEARAEKAAVVDEVREKFSASDAAVLTEYRGLDVPAMAELRRALRQSGGEYKVYKNTLVRFAVDELGLEIEDLSLIHI